MASLASTEDIIVLVTGFGPFLDITKNPSWEIASNMPAEIASSNGTPIKLIVPDAPMPAAYHKILTRTVALIEEHKPQIVVHMGLAVDRNYFAVEESAQKEGYHDIPDVDRKVFTRAENKKTFNKSPASLVTSLGLDTSVSAWQIACSTIGMPIKGAPEPKGKAKGKQVKKMVDVRLSDDVGTYVCGFIYYVSMLEMQKRTGKRDVVFFHVPSLDDEQVTIGVEVTRELIRALVDEWELKA